MKRLLSIAFRAVRAALKRRNDLVIENSALRQQLAMLKSKRTRPRLAPFDRAFWVPLRIQRLANSLLLGDLLSAVGEHEPLAHWTQGEFHHDVLLRPSESSQGDLAGPVLVVSTNCNGGVKEILCFGEVPDRDALWHYRCPESPDFSGTSPPILGAARTVHWFDPCQLLTKDVRSELKPEFRRRQRGGGWVSKDV